MIAESSRNVPEGRRTAHTCPSLKTLSKKIFDSHNLAKQNSAKLHQEIAIRLMQKKGGSSIPFQKTSQSMRKLAKISRSNPKMIPVYNKFAQTALSSNEEASFGPMLP